MASDSTDSPALLPSVPLAPAPAVPSSAPISPLPSVSGQDPLALSPLETSPDPSSNLLPAVTTEEQVATNRAAGKTATQPTQSLRLADRHVKYADATKGDASAIILNQPSELPERSAHSHAQNVSTVTAAASLAFAHRTPLEDIERSQTAQSVGRVAAAIASREHHPVEFGQPSLLSSAGQAAASIASKEHKLQTLWASPSDSFASQAATRAHANVGPSAGPLIEDLSISRSLKQEPANQSEKLQVTPSATLPSRAPLDNNRLRSQGKNEYDTALPTYVSPSSGDKDETAGDASRSRRRSDIVRAATISMGKVGKSPTEGRVLRKRPAYSNNLQQAAKEIATRRLERLEAEHLQSSGIMRRLSLPTFTSLGRAQGSLSEIGQAGPSSGVPKKEVKDYQQLMERARQNAQETIGNIDKEVLQKKSFSPRKIWETAAKEKSEIATSEHAEHPTPGEWLLRASTTSHMEAEKDVRSIERQKLEGEGIVPSEGWVSLTTKSAEPMPQQNSEKRVKQVDKIDIGGGRLMDRREIEDIASRHVKPLLEEIDQKAERERARHEQERLGRLEKERQKDLERHRLKKLKEEKRRIKALEKELAQKRKEEEKQEKKRQKAAHRRSFIFPLATVGESNIPVQRPETPVRIMSGEGERPLSPPISPNGEAASGLRSWFSRLRERGHQRGLSTTQAPLPGAGPAGQAEVTPPSSPREPGLDARPFQDDLGLVPSEAPGGVIAGGLSEQQLEPEGEILTQTERPISPTSPTTQPTKHGISGLVSSIARKASLRRKDKRKGKEEEREKGKGREKITEEEKGEGEKIEASPKTSVAPIASAISGPKTSLEIVGGAEEAVLIPQSIALTPPVTEFDAAERPLFESAADAPSPTTLVPISKGDDPSKSPIFQSAAPAISGAATRSHRAYEPLEPKDLSHEKATVSPVETFSAPIVLSSGPLGSSSGPSATLTEQQRLSPSIYGASSGPNQSSLAGSVGGRNFESRFRENL